MDGSFYALLVVFLHPKYIKNCSSIAWLQSVIANGALLGELDKLRCTGPKPSLEEWSKWRHPPLLLQFSPWTSNTAVTRELVICKAPGGPLQVHLN